MKYRAHTCGLFGCAWEIIALSSYQMIKSIATWQSHLVGIWSAYLEVFVLDWASFTACSLSSLGPFPCLPSDKKLNSTGLHHFKCIYMRFFSGTVHQKPSLTGWALQSGTSLSLQVPQGPNCNCDIMVCLFPLGLYEDGDIKIKSCTSCSRRNHWKTLIDTVSFSQDFVRCSVHKMTWNMCTWLVEVKACMRWRGILVQHFSNSKYPLQHSWRYLHLYTRKENIKQESIKVICLLLATHSACTVFWSLVLSLVSQAEENTWTRSSQGASVDNDTLLQIRGLSTDLS